MTKYWVATAEQEWHKRVALICAAAFLTTIGVFLPREGDPNYHCFADTRWQNALNVWSNVGFLAAGVWGLWQLRRKNLPWIEAVPWWVFFLGNIATFAGSAWYHMAPDDFRLVFDRLPMTVAFTGLLAVLLNERVKPRLGTQLLLLLIAIGAFTVLFWYCTGNLAPYSALQAFAALGMLFMLIFFKPSYSGDRYLYWAVAWYAVAKVLESQDRTIYAIGVSGHTLKHLAASVSSLMLVRLLQRRSAIVEHKTESVPPGSASDWARIDMLLKHGIAALIPIAVVLLGLIAKRVEHSYSSANAIATLIGKSADIDGVEKKAAIWFAISSYGEDATPALESAVANECRQTLTAESLAALHYPAAPLARTGESGVRALVRLLGTCDESYSNPDPMNNIIPADKPITRALQKAAEDDPDVAIPVLLDCVRTGIDRDRGTCAVIIGQYAGARWECPALTRLTEAMHDENTDVIYAIGRIFYRTRRSCQQDSFRARLATALANTRDPAVQKAIKWSLAQRWTANNT